MTVPDWWAALLLTLAAYRLYRLVAQDTILDRPRAWLLNAGGWRPDSSGVPPAGFRDGLATFISCPWCAGFWISGLVLAAYYLGAIDDPWGWDAAGGFVVTWLAISTVVGLCAKNLDE